MYCDFVWGSRENAWEQFCKHKNDGGLGFRDLHAFNKALIMKLGWGLIHNRGALWVEVIRSKYKYGEDLIPVVENWRHDLHDLEGYPPWFTLGDW